MGLRSSLPANSDTESYREEASCSSSCGDVEALLPQNVTAERQQLQRLAFSQLEDVLERTPRGEQRGIDSLAPGNVTARNAGDPRQHFRTIERTASCGCNAMTFYRFLQASGVASALGLMSLQLVALAYSQVSDLEGVLQLMANIMHILASFLLMAAATDRAFVAVALPLLTESWTALGCFQLYLTLVSATAFTRCSCASVPEDIRREMLYLVYALAGLAGAYVLFGLVGGKEIIYRRTVEDRSLVPLLEGVDYHRGRPDLGSRGSLLAGNT